MKYLLAIDSFKGCLSSAQVEDTISAVLKERGDEVTLQSMSDGGDGMLEIFTSALQGKLVETMVHDPLMRRIPARYGITDDGTAIIDSSQACGLTLMQKEELRPLLATSYGVGELLAHALLSGCKKFIIGLGGSGTSDAGIGMLKGVIDILSKRNTIDDVINTRLEGCQFILASDVQNPLYGESGAALVYAQQKGATEGDIEVLDARAKKFAEVSAKHFNRDCASIPGAGAAGGLGYAFLQYFNASIKSGAELLMDITHFDEKIGKADIIITGEGYADQQTLMGKLPQCVLKRAQKLGVPTWLIAGKVEDYDLFLSAGFEKVIQVTPETMSLDEAMQPKTAIENIKKALFAQL